MVKAVSKERWDQAQVEEAVDYDTESFDSYKNSHKVILTDHFGLDMDKDLVGKKVIESGGGCYPAVYFCTGLEKAVNVEPLYYQFPEHIKYTMEKSGVESCSVAFEDYGEDEKFDEAWFFNVLMHVIDPYLQVEMAKKIAKTIRIFEPVNTVTNIEHPHTFTYKWFEEQFPGVEVKRYVGGSTPRFHGADCAYLTWEA